MGWGCLVPGGGSVVWGEGAWSGGSVPGRVPVQEGAWLGVPGLGGYPVWGCLALGGAWWRPPTPRMATAAGGTHPTGMHYC